MPLPPPRIGACRPQPLARGCPLPPPLRALGRGRGHFCTLQPLLGWGITALQCCWEPPGVAGAAGATRAAARLAASGLAASGRGATWVRGRLHHRAARGAMEPGGWRRPGAGAAGEPGPGSEQGVPSALGLGWAGRDGERETSGLGCPARSCPSSPCPAAGPCPLSRPLGAAPSRFSPAD